MRNNKFLKYYNHCIFCGSKKFEKANNQNLRDNFYLKAIRNDLEVKSDFFLKMQTYKCQNCYIIQNNPWFNETIIRKIFSNIYGQHNRGWTNLIRFFKEKKIPDHGKLFQILDQKIKVKHYCEFNTAFTGIMLNFLLKEYNGNFKVIKKLIENAINYLSARQVAGKSENEIKIHESNSRKYLKKIKNIKKLKNSKKIINKSLIVDHSPLCWGQNDNYRSVSSRALASEILDLKILDLNNENNNNSKFDLFGIFHTLDHTTYPRKILNYSLAVSDYVIIYCHINPNLEKQHLFTITNEFKKYLKKIKVNFIDLSDKIMKNYKTQELYVLCSKKKKLTNLIFNNK